MKILVTGGAGYIGSILCEHLLDAGHQVTVLDNLMYGAAGLFHLTHREGFEFVRGDARWWGDKIKLLQNAEVIIPLAAIVGAPACNIDDDLAIMTNFNAISELVDNSYPDQLIIYPTTNSGYGIAAPNEVCTEDTPLTPISIYGRTKCDAERVVLDWHNTISLHLANVFGCSPRMRLDLLVNDFTYRAFTDGYITLYESHFMRNYVHIRDVADCFLHCIRDWCWKRKMVGKAYNVGLDSANLSKIELAEKIGEHIPNFCIVEDNIGRDPDQRNYIVSNQRLKDAGFEATRTLDQGIEELIKGFKMMGRSRYSNV